MCMTGGLYYTYSSNLDQLKLIVCCGMFVWLVIVVLNNDTPNHVYLSDTPTRGNPIIELKAARVAHANRIIDSINQSLLRRSCQFVYSPNE